MSKLPSNVDEDEDGMDIDSNLQLERSQQIASRTLAAATALAKVLRDAPEWLSDIRRLQPQDVIILLTPVVFPVSQEPTDSSDPFEPLGRYLSRRHAKIRHVPYTKRHGITSTHLGFIKRGHAIILCLAEQPLQLELVDIVLAIRGDKPVVVVCCSPLDTKQALPFPTVIDTAGYSRPALEATAELIFAERSLPTAHSLPDSSNESTVQPKVWPVEDFVEQRDIASVATLWLACLGERFALDQQTLANVLRKPGYSKHYVVRNPSTGETLGFCATYLSYVDREGEKLVASLAILVVHPQTRFRGIGLSLHNHAINSLKRTRGIIRLQLGSTFPRLLYGPPSDDQSSDEWFRRRGWQFDKGAPGQGQVVHDFLLEFKDWHYRPGSSSTTEYRVCTQDDMTKVIDLVERTSALDDRLGWFDQYWTLINGPNVKDIVVAVEEQDIVGTALTYSPGGSQMSNNIPWPCRIGNDVGGVTCVSMFPDKRHIIMSGLINTCVETLRTQGMKRLFLDGVTDHSQFFTNLGFKEWARYRDVWKSV
ncbi:uncharacterized protein LY89DRAFT_233894 [Mollisia scopiformis]|uniref:N-acetyltransferase domain-containing protein n=1 Tax=Mollisia scopiformis TaxID=149040 RepID=A0A194WUY7_MOLSC|nr:uncharacterized protein LY89DRAFT_233894 [Mollisia scopiformis]KUJ11770.1 hypothetical protein LY89DRAFT_233894 [Mollisia scopiformis]